MTWRDMLSLPHYLRSVTLKLYMQPLRGDARCRAGARFALPPVAYRKRAAYGLCWQPRLYLAGLVLYHRDTVLNIQHFCCNLIPITRHTATLLLRCALLLTSALARCAARAFARTCTCAWSRLPHAFTCLPVPACRHLPHHHAAYHWLPVPHY